MRARVLNGARKVNGRKTHCDTTDTVGDSADLHWAAKWCYGASFSMRWSRRHLVLSSGVLRVQWLFAFACVLTRTCVSASVTTPVTCGTSFVDTASSAYLAEVVLEGRVREKINGSGGHFYNISIQLRKNVLKGKDLVNGGKKLKKLTLGKFFHAGDNEVLPEEVSGSSSGNDCVGHVEDGATYIFFLRNVGDKKGKYFEISAKPVKSSRQTLSTVTKAIGPKGGKHL